MKMIYIANIRMPTEKAHGVQIMKMCEAFSLQDVDVELIVPWRFNHIKDNPFFYYGVKENFKIKKVFSLDLVKFGRVGFWVQSISFAIFSFLHTVFKKVDIIYSRDELPLFLLSFFKKNIVYEAHTPRFNFIIKKFKKIIAISNGLKQFYVKSGILEEKITVAHDGVDLKDFEVEVDKNKLKEKFGIPNDKPIVMYIGRIDTWKGVQTLLDVSTLMSEITVVIAGEGEELEGFKKKFKNVIFLGITPYRDLPRNQKIADALVIPNSAKSEVSRMYTSPLKVFAHMASGVPVVASDLPSIREVLNEENSVLVESDNPSALVNGVKKVLEKYDTFGGKLSQKASLDVEKYTWEKRAKNILMFIITKR